MFSLPLHLNLPRGLFLTRSLTKTMCAPPSAVLTTCPAHLHHE
jgi:hypothetical protein